jgi:PAS domain S-box-containing protein
MDKPDPSAAKVIRLIDFRFFQLLFRDLQTGALIADSEGRIQHANQAVVTLLGWSTDELVGRNLAELLSFEYRALDPQSLLGAEMADAAVHGLHQDGRWLPLRLALSVLRDAGGEAQGLVALLADDSQADRERTRLTSLIQLGAALNAEDELPALLEQILRDARALFQVDAVHVSRLDEQTRQVVPIFQHGPGMPPDPVPPVSLDQTDTAIVQAVLERRPIIRQSPRAPGHDGDGRARSWVQSHLVVPLVRGEQVLGTFCLLDTHQYDRFSDDDIVVARTYAELAAVALEDARLHEATRRQNERLQTLARVSHLLTASLERTSVFNAIARGAEDLLGADEVRVWLLTGPEGPFRLAHFHGDIEAAYRLDLDYWSSRVGEMVRSGRPWQTSDIRNERRHFKRSRSRDHGLRACLSVPLVGPGQPIGALTMLSRQVKRFDEDEVELALSFASQAAIAVQNAAVLERERQTRWLDELLQRPDGLPAATRRDVEHLISIAERLIDASETARSCDRAETVRSMSDG